MKKSSIMYLEGTLLDIKENDYNYIKKENKTIINELLYYLNKNYNIFIIIIIFLLILLIIYTLIIKKILKKKYDKEYNKKYNRIINKLLNKKYK